MCRLSWNLEASTSWKPHGLSRPVQISLYLFNRKFTRTTQFYLIYIAATSLDVVGIHRNMFRDYINNCPTRCNKKQSIYYSASSLYMFRVSTKPIMSTQNCNYSLPPSNVAKLAWPRWREGGCSYSFVYSWWWVWLTPETCRVFLQNNE